MHLSSWYYLLLFAAFRGWPEAWDGCGRRQRRNEERGRPGRDESLPYEAREGDITGIRTGEWQLRLATALVHNGRNEAYCGGACWGDDDADDGDGDDDGDGGDGGDDDRVVVVWWRWKRWH